MKDIILISNYDTGCDFSIMINGSILYKEDEPLAEKICDAYNTSNKKDFKMFCEALFGKKTLIIICDNGNIELL